MGYKTISPIEISNITSAYLAGNISYAAMRTSWALLEAQARREAADRVRLQKRKAKAEEQAKKNSKRKTKPAPEFVPTTDYTLKEISDTAWLSQREVREAINSLQKTGIVSYSSEEISFRELPITSGSHALLADISESRPSNRPIPFPRKVLTFLARCKKPSLAMTVLAYIVRGLSFVRGEKGSVSAKGTVKATWISQVFGLSERAVRYARNVLIKAGFITADTTTHQLKLNKDGAYFNINVDWDGNEPTDETVIQEAVTACGNCTPTPSEEEVSLPVEIAPLPPQTHPEFAPLYRYSETLLLSEEDLDTRKAPEGDSAGVCKQTLSDSEIVSVTVAQPDVRTEQPQGLVSRVVSGILSTARRVAPSIADYRPVTGTVDADRLVWGPSKPSFNNIQNLDLRNIHRIKELFSQAADRGLVKRSQADALKVVAIAKKAITMDNPGGYFRTTVADKNAWGKIGEQHENNARQQYTAACEQYGHEYFLTAHTSEELLSMGIKSDLHAQPARQPAPIQRRQPPVPSNKRSQEEIDRTAREYMLSKGMDPAKYGL